MDIGYKIVVVGIGKIAMELNQYPLKTIFLIKGAKGAYL